MCDYDSFPDMDLDGDHDIFDCALYEEMEDEEKKRRQKKRDSALRISPISEPEQPEVNEDYNYTHEYHSVEEIATCLSDLQIRFSEVMKELNDLLGL